MTRHEFMAAYRAMCGTDGPDLTADDRHEVFRGIMLGESDFSIELFNDILADYGVEWSVRAVYPDDDVVNKTNKQTNEKMT
jgi:hypothetical protein